MNAIESPVHHRWARLLAICLGTLLGPLDSAVNIAFPDITASFQLELQSIRWVVIFYVATYASLMLVFGRVGDLFGHHRVFGIGLVVCIIAFIICGTARTYDLLLISRTLQGIGTAMVLSCGPALATNLFSENDRPRVLGTYAMMFGLGGAVGPSLGGLLVEVWGWPAVFWFRLPIAVAALALLAFLKMPSPPRDAGRFDLTGSAFLALATGSVLLTFSQLQSAHEQPLKFAILCAATLIMIAIFFKSSRKAPSVVLDWRAFTQLPFAWINITNVVVSFAAFAVMLFVPYFLVRISNLPVWQSGIVMAAGPLAMMAASLVGGQFARAAGSGRLALAGAISVAAATGLISLWEPSTTRVVLAASLLLHGVGLGLFQIACLEIVATTLPKTNRGVAGSLVMVMRTVGIVIAASILTIVFAGIDQNSAARGASGSFVIAFQLTFSIVAIALFVYIAISCLRPRLWMGQQS